MRVARQQVSLLLHKWRGGRFSSIVNYEKRKSNFCNYRIAFRTKREPTFHSIFAPIHFVSVLFSFSFARFAAKCFKRSGHKFIKASNGTRDHGKRRRNYHGRVADVRYRRTESHLAGSGMATLLDRPRSRPTTREREERESNVSISP